MSKLASGNVAEVRSLTGLRGVAALYVVLFHYFNPGLLTNPFLCFLGHGYLAVDLFFPLSGFVMALNYTRMFSSGVTLLNYRTFLLRRLARIYPLYLLTLIGATVLIASGRLEFRGASLISAFWSNAFLIQNWGSWLSLNVPSWSISTEWLAYLLFPVLLQVIFFRSVRVAQSVLILCILSLGGLYAFSLFRLDWPKVFDQTMGPASVIRCVSEFSLGILAFRSRSNQLAQRLINLQGIAGALVVTCVLLLAFKGTDLALALIFPLVILSLDNRSAHVSRLLGSMVFEYVGLLSFSIYLLHALFNPIVDALDGSFGRLGWPHARTCAVAATLPILLIAAACTYHFVEVPGRRMVRNILEPKPQNAGLGS